MFPLEVSNCSLNCFVTFRRNLIPSEKCSPSVCAAHGRFTNPKMSTACYLWQRPCLPVKVPLTALRNTCHLRHHCFLTQTSSPRSLLPQLVGSKYFWKAHLYYPSLLLLFCLCSSQASRTGWICKGCIQEMLSLLHPDMHPPASFAQAQLLYN